MPHDSKIKKISDGMNDHIRLSKYDPGQFFGIHKDGINFDDRNKQNMSYATLNIFSNDNFEGGETIFYKNDKKKFYNYYKIYIDTVSEIIKKVGKVNYGESNYATGPMTKTIYVEDTFGSHYKISIEDLKHVKGHGWITHAEADKLDIHYDKDLGYYVVNTPEYSAWMKEAREKNFPSSPQLSLF